MLEFLRKYFQQEGAEAGKTTLAEEESLLKKDETAQDKTGTEVIEEEEIQTPGNTDVELKQGNDLSFEEFDENLNKLKAKILNKTPEAKTEDKKSVEDKTKSEENLLFDPNKGGEDQSNKADKSNAPVTITKEYVASQPKEHQELLNRMIGETFTPKALKSWVHSQLHISELSNNPVKQPEKPIEPVKPNGNAITEEEIAAERKAYLTNKLKSAYPDLTEDVFQDESSLEEFVAELKMHSPVKAERFIKSYFEQEGNWNTSVTKFVSYSNNWEEISRAKVVDVVQKFDTYLNKYGVKADALGIKYTEKFIMDNFIAPEGKPNRSIVSYLDKGEKIPVIDEKALLFAMKEKYEDFIADAVRSSAVKEVVENRTKRETPPSISTSSIHKQIDKPEPIEKLIREDMPIEEMDKIMEAQKKSIIQKYQEG